MSDLSLADIMSEIDGYLAEKTPASLKMAIIDAHKTLDALLSSKGYPGRSIEKKLFWAGFSLKGKDDFLAALEMHKVISEKLEFQLSDFEAKETVAAYKKVIKVIAEREKLSLGDRAKNFVEMYLAPTSLVFWRNLAIFFGIFGLIKLFSSFEPAKNLMNRIVEVANFIISWQFLLIVAILVGIAYFLFNYFTNKSKVRIKEDQVKIKEYGDERSDEN
jgi:hypothetical protein